MSGPTPGTPVLEVRGLAKRFTLHLRGAVERTVLRDVSLSVRAGDCVALVGPSGRGKSTLVKCLYGSYAIDAGSAVLHAGAGAIDLAHASAQQIITLRRQELSYVSQFLRVVPRVPTLELLVQRCVHAEPHVVPADSGATGHATWPDTDPPHGVAQARERAQALLARLNLPSALWELPPATFSGGEQQRVNLARGFIVPARLLLLDEPTAALDAHNRRVVIELIGQAKAQGTAIVGIFHDAQVRDAVATHCLEMA